jgi:hypothetical protein
MGTRPAKPIRASFIVPVFKRRERHVKMKSDCECVL